MPYLKRLTCLGLLFLTMSIFLVVTGVFLKIPIAEQVSNSDKTMGVTFLVLSCTAIVYGEKACNLLILKINQTINQLAGLPKDYAAHLYGTEPAEISIGHSHHHPPYT